MRLVLQPDHPNSASSGRCRSRFVSFEGNQPPEFTSKRPLPFKLRSYLFRGAVLYAEPRALISAVPATLYIQSLHDDYRSFLLALALDVASSARSSSPAPTTALVAFCPSGLLVSASNSVSMVSLVVSVNSSTSAAVRCAVGIGGRTAGSLSAVELRQ